MGPVVIRTLWRRGAGVAGTYPAPAHHGSEPIFHHIEVARVGGTFKIRSKRRHAVSETIPVEAKEERMLLEIACSIPAQPCLWGTQQSLDEVASLLGDSCTSQRQSEVLLLRGRGKAGCQPGSRGRGIGAPGALLTL